MYCVGVIQRKKVNDSTYDFTGSKAALVYGQMNEPPGARARVALTGLTVAEYFRDEEGQDVLLFIDNIYRFTQAGSEVSALLGNTTVFGFLTPKLNTIFRCVLRLRAHTVGCWVPANVSYRPRSFAGTHHDNHKRIYNVGTSRLRSGGRLDGSGAGNNIRSFGCYNCFIPSSNFRYVCFCLDNALSRLRSPSWEFIPQSIRWTLRRECSARRSSVSVLT